MSFPYKRICEDKIRLVFEKYKEDPSFSFESFLTTCIRKHTKRGVVVSIQPTKVVNNNIIEFCVLFDAESINLYEMDGCYTTVAFDDINDFYKISLEYREYFE